MWEQSNMNFRGFWHWEGEIIQEDAELFKLCFLDYILGILGVDPDVPKHSGLSSPVLCLIWGLLVGFRFSLG